MEFVGNSPNKILGTAHGPGYSGGESFGGEYDVGSPVAGGWHEVAIEWSPQRIAWEVDGVTYHEAAPEQVAPNEWVFDHEFFLLINLAVGGTLGGAVTDDLEQPQDYRLDYAPGPRGAGRQEAAYGSRSAVEVSPTRLRRSGLGWPILFDLNRQRPSVTSTGHEPVP